MSGLYLPATHDEHDPPFGPVHPTLQMQWANAELPEGASEFVLQAWHVDSDVLPEAIEYLPRPQSEQTSGPAAALYFPASHSEQAPPSGPEEPALHVQSVKAQLPVCEFEFLGQAKHVETAVAPTAVEYLPCSQRIHASDPAADLYLPATQPIHWLLPPGLVKPALHRQSEAASDPAGEFEFKIHCKHVLSDVCQFDGEYFPAPQSMHAASPVSALNLPATHPTHGPPLGPVNPALQAQSEDESLPSGAFELAVQLEQVLSKDFPVD